jgi:serine/threonine protein kinase
MMAQMNVMVDANQRAVLIDFGNSVVIQAPERQREWGKMSTLAWQAPEIHGQGFDGQAPRIVHTISSEIWSFGVVMFEVCGSPSSLIHEAYLLRHVQVLTGHLPYRRAHELNRVSWMIEHGQKPWNPEDVINFNRPDFALMNRCLEYSPQGRPQLQQVVEHLAHM